MHIGQTIRRIRERKGLQQNELAAALDYDAGNLSRLERGEIGVTWDLLERLRHTLGMPLWQIVKEWDENAPPAGAPAERPDIFEIIARQLNTRNLATAASALAHSMPSRVKLRVEDRARLIEHLYQLVRPDGSIDAAKVASVVQGAIDTYDRRRESRDHAGKRRQGNLDKND